MICFVVDSSQNRRNHQSQASFCQVRPVTRMHHGTGGLNKAQSTVLKVSMHAVMRACVSHSMTNNQNGRAGDLVRINDIGIHSCCCAHTEEKSSFGGWPANQMPRGLRERLSWPRMPTAAAAACASCPSCLRDRLWRPRQRAAGPRQQFLHVGGAERSVIRHLGVCKCRHDVRHDLQFDHASHLHAAS